MPTAIGDGEVIEMGRNDGQAVADPRAKAQDEVERLFPPVLKEVAGLDGAVASTSATLRELGWLGIQGLVVVGQIQLFLRLMRMDPSRKHHQLALRRVADTRQFWDSQRQRWRLPESHARAHPSRMAHKGEVGEVRANPGGSLHRFGFGGLAGTTAEVFQRGPNTPLGSEQQQVVELAVGLAPAGVIGLRLPVLAGPKAAKTVAFTHLRYALEGGFLVIPTLEGSPVPAGCDRLQAVSANEVSLRGVDNCVKHQYWRMRRTWPKVQRGLFSDLMVSVMSILEHVFGPKEVEDALDNPVSYVNGLGSATQRKEFVDEIKECLALELWHPPPRPGHESRRARIDSLYLDPGEVRIAPHLTGVRSSALLAHQMFLITQARSGSIMLGCTVDDCFPPQHPHTSFCPCCFQPGSETWTHHLNGHCTVTKGLLVEYGKPLVQEMKQNSREWAEEWKAATGDDDRRTAVLLATADFELVPDEWGCLNRVATTLLVKWLASIVAQHPLCQWRSKREHLVDLQYCDRPFLREISLADRVVVEQVARKMIEEGSLRPHADELQALLPRHMLSCIRRAIREEVDCRTGSAMIDSKDEAMGSEGMESDSGVLDELETDDEESDEEAGTNLRDGAPRWGGDWRYERVASATGGGRRLPEIEFQRQQQRAERRYGGGSGKKNAGATSIPKADRGGKRQKSSAQEGGSYHNGRNRWK